MKSNWQRYVVVIFLFFLSEIFISCRSVTKRLDSNKDLIADTGELTRYELEKAAAKFAEQIVDYFQKNSKEEGVFIAFLPTKNETSESLSTKVFDNTIVQELIKNNIFTVRVNNRKSALKEFEFSQTGLTDGTISVGKLKSPNFFIYTQIDENIFRHDGNKIIEQIINLELTEVETLIVIWSDKVTYQKKVSSDLKITW